MIESQKRPREPVEDNRGLSQFASWKKKFWLAWLGIGQGIKGQSSFLVHIPSAIGVIVASCWLRLSLERLCVILLCVCGVLTAELFNSAIEWASKSIAGDFDPNVEKALNIASGAVLVVSIFSAVIGLLVFVDALTWRPT